MKRLYALVIAAALCFPSIGANAWWQSIQQVGVAGGPGPLSCSYTPVTNAMQGVAYTGATPSASGGTPTYSFSETGSLPTGLTINSTTGVISGTPSVNGSFPIIQVVATDSLSATANCGASFTLVIATTLTCSYTPVTTGTQGAAYTGATPSASGGTTTYSFSETGSLPTGLTINSTTGIISGTPSVNGSFLGIQVVVTDANSFTANCGSPFTLTISPSGSAMVTPMLAASGNTGTGPSNSATNYSSFYQSNASSAPWNAAGQNRGIPIPIPGVVSNFIARTPVTVTGSYAFTVFKGTAGSGTSSATAITCSVSSSTPCQDNTNTASVSSGDTIVLQSVPTGTPTAVAAMQWSAIFTSTNNGEGFLVFPWSSGASTSVVNYMGLNSLATPNATEVNASSVLPTAGSVDHLYVNGTGSPGAAKSYAIAVCKNGTCTSTPTCTLTGASGTASLSCNDTSTGAVSYSAGDTISIQITPSGTPGASQISASVRWIPTTAGEAVISMTGSATSGAGTTNANLSGSGFLALEANAANIVPAVNFTVKKMQWSVNTAVGGTSRVFSLRSGAATVGTPGNVTCTMTSAQLTCSDLTNSFSTTTAGTLMNFQQVATGAVNAATWAKATAIVTVP